MPKYLTARKFRLHFNRINMQKGLPTVWTIHRSDRCIPARKVRVYVELETLYSATGRQPRATLYGEGVVIDAGDGDFVIVTPQQAYALMFLGRDTDKEVRIV